MKDLNFIFPNENNKYSSDMDAKQKIEEILLNDFGCFDDFTVDKLLDLFSVRQRTFTEWLRKNFQNNVDDESLWEDYNMIIDRPPKMYTSNELLNWYDQYVA